MGVEVDIENQPLSPAEKKRIRELLNRQSSQISDDLEQIWYLMDLTWDEYGCDNKNLNWQNISSFYSDPIWLLNGLFIEQHKLSMQHRSSIAEWIATKGVKKILDYGGGFGTLARLVAQKNPDLIVEIYEPHPSDFGIQRTIAFENIVMVDTLSDGYDVLLSTDVLEHVPDPLSDFSSMIDSVKTGGYLVIANCFYPVIKCHLPKHFHFRYTFNIFAKVMGLTSLGNIEGSHATLYQKTKIKKHSWLLLRSFEMTSKIMYPFFCALTKIRLKIKQLLLR